MSSNRSKARRRGHGDGSIYQRASDGRWVGVVEHGYRTSPKTGKRVRNRITVYGTTRREVAEKLRAKQHEVAKGIDTRGSEQTIAQFLDTWIADSVAGRTRPKTLKSYAEIVRIHLKPAIGHIRLSKLRQHHVQRLLRDKEEAGFAPSTVGYIRAVLRNALNDAMRWDYVGRNVAALVRPPAQQKQDRRYLSPDEERRLLAVAGDGPLEYLYLVALRLGLRQGEILALQWKDVDFERSDVRVRRTVIRTPIVRDAEGNPVSGGLQFALPKTERSRRTIPLTLEVRRALEKQHEKVYGALGIKAVAGSHWQEHDLVFPSISGTPIDASALTQRFHRHCTAAGIEGMTFHGLRHTAASRMAASNIPPRVVMEILGHSQISTTMEIYSHISTDDVRRALEGVTPSEPTKIRAD